MLLQRGFLPWLANQETRDILMVEIERAEEGKFRPAAYSINKLAERWEISGTQIRHLIASGKLPAFKLGETLWRIRAETVEQFERDALGLA